MGLKAYIARRVLEVIPVVFTVIVITFFLIRLAPGDVAIVMAGEFADPVYIEHVREMYGLNKPLSEQFVIYITNILQGDLGRSYVYARPVLSLISERIGVTLSLIIPSTILSATIGTLLGIYAAKKHPSKTDMSFSYVPLFVYSTPIFLLGMILILSFGYYLRIFPIAGIMSIGKQLTGIAHILDLLWHAFLPILTLSLWWLSHYVRVSRAQMIEIKREDFMATYRAIGYNSNTIYFRRALRNALLPIITITGMQIGYALAGSILIETVFAWPGMGSLILEAIMARDYPIITGSYIVLSVSVVVANLLTDIIYGIIDPRIVYK